MRLNLLLQDINEEELKEIKEERKTSNANP
jgi:hypothetical protein